MHDFTETQTFDLVLSQEMLPRTTTRERWRKIYRARRTAQRELARIMDDQIRTLANYGSAVPPPVRETIIDKMVNPPIFAWPTT